MTNQTNQTLIVIVGARTLINCVRELSQRGFYFDALRTFMKKLPKDEIKRYQRGFGLWVCRIEEFLSFLDENKKAKFQQIILEVIAKNPLRISPEVRIITHLSKTRKISSICWLHANTNTGFFTSAVLTDFISHLKPDLKIESHSINGFENPNTLYEGMINMVNCLQKIISKHNRKQISVCVPSSFKAESALIALVSVIEGIPVYLIHEAYDRVVVLPPLKLKLQIKEVMKSFLKAFVEINKEHL